jgi:hypothetical protein
LTCLGFGLVLWRGSRDNFQETANLAVEVLSPSDRSEALIGPNDVLSGGAVLPAFKCKLNQIFGPTA